MLVSAPNAGALFDLRCDVREGMVSWLHRTQPGALPRRRIQPAPTPDDDGGAHQVSPAAPRAGSGLFSGSPGAEQRSRVFEGPSSTEDDDIDRREFADARTNGG
jgi:hypothetical protein